LTIGIAAQSVGVAQAAFDAAVRYAQEREQFGRPISKFQGLRWMIADMATEIEAARLMTFSAAEMKDRGENYTAQASMAKLFASGTADTALPRNIRSSAFTGMPGYLPSTRAPPKFNAS
jgi:alkylation response protein AidB-like acyl-CoA dehydrogenase